MLFPELELFSDPSSPAGETLHLAAHRLYMTFFFFLFYSFRLCFILRVQAWEASPISWFSVTLMVSTWFLKLTSLHCPQSHGSGHISCLPGGTTGEEPACQCRRHNRCGFDPWVRKIPWRRAWKPTPVFLPGQSHGQRSLVGYSPWGHRVRHDWSNLACTHNYSFNFLFTECIQMEVKTLKICMNKKVRLPGSLASSVLARR